MSTYRDHASEARRLIGREALQGLSRERRPGLVIGLTALLWAQLLLALGVAGLAPPWAAALALPFIIVLQHAMVLWVHEASHYTLFQDRRWNDLWANLFLASPVGMNVVAYRGGHMTHHRDLAGDEDRDRWTYEFDIRGAGLARTILSVLTGFHGIRVAWRKYGRSFLVRADEDTVPPQLVPLAMSALWNLALLGFFFWAGRWYLYFAFWLYPVLTSMVLITILHTIGEHQPDGYDGDASFLPLHPITRTTVPNPVEKWAIYQTNFNLHFEHHVFPSVPFFNLPRVHRMLRDGGFYESHPELVQRSLLSRLRLLCRPSAAPARPAVGI